MHYRLCVCVIFSGVFSFVKLEPLKSHAIIIPMKNSTLAEIVKDVADLDGPAVQERAIGGRSLRRLAAHTPWLGFISSLLIVLAVSRTPQSLFSDPAWQLKALQQHIAGESPNFNTLVQANPHDVSQDTQEWISWWPVGTNVLVYPLLSLGLTLAMSIRIISACALILGSIGFGFWIRAFRLPHWLAISLALTIPWIRYANLPLFQYAAEGLVFAVAPWAFVGAIRLASSWTGRRKENLPFLVGYGLLLGFSYWFKYSAVFISAGVLLHLAITAWKQRGQALKDVAIVSVIFLLVVGSLNALNHLMGAAMNAVTEHLSFVMDWRLPFNFVGLLAMAMADADGLARYVLFHPGRNLLPFNYATLCYLGLPGGVVLFWLLVRRHSSPVLLLSRDALLTISAFFIAVMTVFSARAMEARYIAAFGMALIPAALQVALDFAPKLGRARRAILLLMAACYLVIPITYGGFSIIGKIARTPTRYQAGPSGFYNPLFADADAKSAIAELIAHFDRASDVWYLTEPYTAMDLPGRVILRHADFLPIAALKDSFHTSRAVRVHLLLPPWFEQNGKGVLIRGQFAGAKSWVSRTFPGMNYIEWTATLRTDPN